MANPIQQGLKPPHNGALHRGDGAAMANPIQQGLKLAYSESVQRHGKGRNG